MKFFRENGIVVKYEVLFTLVEIRKADSTPLIQVLFVPPVAACLQGGKGKS